MVDKIINCQTVEEIKNIISEEKEWIETYESIRFDTLMDILSSTSSRLDRYEEYEKIINGTSFNFSLENFIRSYPKQQQYDFDNLETIIFNKIRQMAMCKKYFSIDYDTYRYIENCNIEGIKFQNKELEDLVNNIKDIQNGKYLIYANGILNAKEHLHQEFESNFNTQLTKLENLTEVSDEFYNKYGLSPSVGLHLLDAGTKFNILVKDMGYAGRIGDNYSEQWNTEEKDFPYESKSVISEQLISTISSDNDSQYNMWEKNWMVGFNQLNDLIEMSSTDIANQPDSNGNFRCKYRPGKNVVKMASLKNIVDHTGYIDDDNQTIWKYNEVTDKKYKGEKKNQPDILILIVSQNEQSKYSVSVKERYEVASQAAQDLEKGKILVIDVDKVLASQIEEIQTKKEKYKETKNLKLIDEMMKQIRNNRVGEYSTSTFDNQYLNSFFEELMDINNKEMMHIIYENLEVMNDYNLKDFYKFMRKDENKIEELLSLEHITELSTDSEDTYYHFQEFGAESLEQYEKIKQELVTLDSKKIKFPSTKRKIKELEERKQEIIVSHLEEVREEISGLLGKKGFRNFDFSTIESIEESIIKYKEKYQEVINTITSPKKIKEVTINLMGVIDARKEFQDNLMEEKKTNYSV